jgi:3'-phosphoadenosine 5'-phosphosulfate sulfotransferase (PAPS reductase)/FAD synthetase
MESNPYKIQGPALISFSGGRTSGFMLWNIIQAHGGTLPKDIYVTFANTGKEAPETLDFVHEIGQKWGVKIHWLELYFGEERPVYRTKEVTYETASRNGEPFEALIDRRKYLPNPVARFCTSELKVKVMSRFMRKLKGHKTWYNVIGLRYDEPRRVSSAMRQNNPWENVLPMYHAKHDVKDVTDFWEKQNFDLNLTNFSGKTLAGNCDLCFLKGKDTKIKLLKERPEMAGWWIKQEQKFGKDAGATFRKDSDNYIKLLDISKQPHYEEQDMFDEQMTCFCHD